MWIIGCDFHPKFQQIAFLDEQTGEYGQRRLEHSSGEAEQFYRALVGQPVRVGLEASGYGRWFERLLAELGHELWVGDAARIRASVVRQQKTDARDAEQLLQLLLQDRFPRIWTATAAERDLRQLVLHRYRVVQMQTKVKNQLQAIAINEGVQQRRKLWSRAGRAQLEALPLPPWTGRRRQDLLQLLEELEERGKPLDQAVAEEAQRRPEVVRLMTHPGIGPVTALSFVLTIGDPRRFPSGKQVGSYLGLIPREHSSGGRQWLGAISKQGNALLRGLLVEAAHQVVRREPHWRRFYVRTAMKHNRGVAAVAVARKLAVRLWWMWLHGLEYGPPIESGSHAG